MKCSFLLALALRAQVGHAFVGPAGGLALSNCFSAAAGATTGILRRGVASTPSRAKASTDDGDGPVVLRKPALVEAMAERGDMSKVQAEAALAAFTDVIKSNVAGPKFDGRKQAREKMDSHRRNGCTDGKKISLQGFGTFEGRSRKGRTGRNPSTGAELTIKPTTVPVFTAAKAFKDMVKAAHTD